METGSDILYLIHGNSYYTNMAYKVFTNRLYSNLIIFIISYKIYASSNYQNLHTWEFLA